MLSDQIKEAQKKVLEAIAANSGETEAQVNFNTAVDAAYEAVENITARNTDLLAQIDQLKATIESKQQLIDNGNAAQDALEQSNSEMEARITELEAANSALSADSTPDPVAISDEVSSDDLEPAADPLTAWTRLQKKFNNN